MMKGMQDVNKIISLNYIFHALHWSNQDVHCDVRNQVVLVMHLQCKNVTVMLFNITLLKNYDKMEKKKNPLTTLYSVSVLHAFLPENIRIPRQDSLQQDWYISLRIITAKVIFQFTVIKERHGIVSMFSKKTKYYLLDYQ